MTVKACRKGQIKLEGKCIDIDLSKSEINDILLKTRIFLEGRGILYVGIDVPLYKKNKGFIDFTRDPKTFEREYRRK